MNINLIPDDDRTNGWSAIAPARTPCAAANGTISADWLVIGGGYAGVAAASRLAELNKGHSVVLVEAGGIGDNASGRNSGFAIDLPHQVGHPDVEAARRYARLSRAGIAHLEKKVVENGIQCEWDKAGKFHCAVTEKTSKKLLIPDVELLERMGEAHRWVSGDEITAETGLSHYHSGVYTPGTVLVNPAALIQGVADNLPDNVRVFENSPVLRLSTDGMIVAETASAVIKAKKLILAVNGFAEQFGIFKSKLIPFVLFASLTERMSSAQQKMLQGNPSWGITPALGTVGPTLRRTTDQRLLIRGGFAYSPSFRCSSAVRENFRLLHKEILKKRFGRVGGELALEHFWMGWLTMTGNGAPGFGRVSDSVFAAVGCGGVGVARQTAAGLAVADLASNVDSQLASDMASLGQPCMLPRRPILDLGVNGYLLKEKIFGHSEA